MSNFLGWKIYSQKNILKSYEREDEIIFAENEQIQVKVTKQSEANKLIRVTIGNISLVISDEGKSIAIEKN